MSVNKNLIFTAIIGLLPVIAFSQNQEQIQDLSFGGSGTEWVHDMVLDDDGYTFIFGSSNSTQNSGNKTASLYGAAMNADLWLIKLDQSGSLLWDKSYGGTGFETPVTLIDGNECLYLVSFSSSDVSGNRTASQKSTINSVDIWVVKVDLSGNIIWDKSFGGNDGESALDAVMTSDGNIVLAGSSNSSNSGDVSSENIYSTTDPWLLKIDTMGNILWQKRYPTINQAQINTIIEDDEGQLIMAISTDTPNDALKQVDIHGDYDIWLLKMDDSGELLSQNSYGGISTESDPVLLFYAGKYYLACSSGSASASGNKGMDNVGVIDIWFLQLNKDLSISREIILGGENIELVNRGLGIYAYGNNDIVVTTSTTSSTNTASWGNTTHYGDADFLIVVMDTTLRISYSVQTGGNDFDESTVTVVNQKGELLLGGTSASPPSGTKKAPLYGALDFWLAWLDTPVFTEEYHQPENSVVLYPNPAVHALHFESGSDYKNYTLFSITGEQLQSGRVTEGQNRIEVADLPSGMYIIRLEGEGVSFTKKWVKG